MKTEKELAKIEEQLTTKLKDMLPNVLVKASSIRGKNTTQGSLHGIIGGKNNVFTDCVRMKFINPSNFIERWLTNLIDKIKTIEKEQKEKYNGNTYPNTSSHRILELLKDKTIREYTLLFLERNFYRNYLERTRDKPDESLWKIWFGGKIYWGLFITPVKRDGEWTCDKSEMRRVDFHYYTIGHVLETGFIDPENDKIINFNSINELCDFYTHFLLRDSSSDYEKQIFNYYVDFIKSINPEEQPHIPILIPEFRYGGNEIKHKYRLDFTILNSYTMKWYGFELSPSSSHMSVSKIKDKKQKDVNEELMEKWDKEMDKRNEFFRSYGITTTTFTDSDLKDIESCWKQIKSTLIEKTNSPVSYGEILNQIDEL